MARRIDDALTQRGMKNIKWATLTLLMTGVYVILTCLVMFHKTDFINITVGSLAIYLLLNADQVRAT